jgi:hypothetical protein
MGQSKTVQSNDPWGPAQPYIINNLKQTQATYDQNQPSLQKYAGMQQGTYGRVAPGAEAGIMGAQSLVNKNLSGGNLAGNPYLDSVLNRTREDVTNSVNSQFSGAGRYGSGAYQGVLAKQLADSENSARMANYGQERGYQQDAIGQGQNLMGGAQGLLNNAAELPWIGTNAANGGIRTASNGYGTQTTTKSASPLDTITGLGGLGLKAFTTFSDDRLKENATPLGMSAGGVPVQSYNFKGDPTPRIGVLASDVMQNRPDALGPTVGGYHTVNYGALGPDGAALAPLAGPQGAPSGTGGGQMNLSAPPIKPGYSDAGGMREKLSNFADSLLAYSGNPLGLAGLSAQATDRQNKFASAQYQRGQADEDRRDQRNYLQSIGLLDYKINHPDDAFSQQLRLANIDPKSPQGQALIQAHLANTVDPVHPVTTANGTVLQGGQYGYSDGRGGVVRPGLGSPPTTANAPPAQAISDLRMHPELAPHFDDAYGQGAAQRALGGQSPATGNFPG